MDPSSHSKPIWYHWILLNVFLYSSGAKKVAPAFDCASCQALLILLPQEPRDVREPCRRDAGGAVAELLQTGAGVISVVCARSERKGP